MYIMQLDVQNLYNYCTYSVPGIPAPFSSTHRQFFSSHWISSKAPVSLHCGLGIARRNLLKTPPTLSTLSEMYWHTKAKSKLILALVL